MALTLEQENALLALLNEPLVTLNELPKVTTVNDGDLFLARQDVLEKAVTGEVMRAYFAAAATLDKAGTVQLTNDIDNDQSKAVTPKAVNSVYTLAESKLSRALNLSDVTNKQRAIENLGLEERLYPVGSPIPWPTNVAPPGYLKCNGAGFDVVQYPKLAKAYPNGILPDLRGEFIRGWDDGRGVDAGRGALSWQGDTLGVHRHASVEWKTSGFAVNEQGIGDNIGGRIHITTQGTSSSNKVNLTGLAGSSETRPRNVAFLYIVKAE